MFDKKNSLFNLFLLGVPLAIVILGGLYLVFKTKKHEPDLILEERQQDFRVRVPSVAGKFYPSDKDKLSSQLDDYLSRADKLGYPGKLRVLIVPHAGIDYSGKTAAWGFKQLEGEEYSRVVLIGASHKKSFKQAAIYDQGVWQTPLGEVEIDAAWAANLIEPKLEILADHDPHNSEHSLEVELIFLQRVLADFKIVPILLSQPSDELIENLAQKIANYTDEQTLVVISTDLSHYPTKEIADQVDKETIEAILKNDRQVFENEVREHKAKNYPDLATSACGYEAVRVGLEIAKILQINDIRLIGYENSGDVTGEETHIVGYASLGAWSEDLPDSALDESAKAEALKIARQTLEGYFSRQEISLLEPHNQILSRPLGAFVTLEKEGQLRGCIGRFEPKAPLYQVIQDMTLAAATEDKRFPPVTAAELPEIEIEVSVMTPRKKIDHWQEIELGRDGVVLQKGSISGTFLPQVAEEAGWSKEEFLAQLCSQKAGLSENCYKDPQVDLYVFEAQVFEE